MQVRRTQAPQDNTQCGYVGWLWGTRIENIIDFLALGASHETHGSKVKRYLCVEPDTRADLMHEVLKPFWKLKPVEKLQIPQHLECTQQERLTGVYSKLQAWKVFAEGRHKLDRVLLMDGDMILNQNVDEIFQARQPAGVMRGEADSCLHDKRPRHTYFQEGRESTFTLEGKKMKGGINGGLVLLEPSTEVFEAMRECLPTFSTPTDMAEQDFLSWYNAGKWNALHKKFNFQIHHLYFSGGEKAPHGQTSSSSYWWLTRHPEDIKIYHFSAEKKPSNMLLDMPTEDVAWQQIDDIMEKFVDTVEHLPAVWDRISQEIWNDEEIYRQIRAAASKSLHTWLLTWISAWDRLMQRTCNMLWNCGMHQKAGNEFQCFACNKTFTNCDEGEVQRDVRDHLFFNCPSMREEVWLSLSGNDMMFDLRKFFFVPTGKNVEKKLLYTAALLRCYTTIQRRSREPWDGDRLSLLKWAPVVIENHYLYDQLPLVTERDRSMDAMLGYVSDPPPVAEEPQEEDRWGPEQKERAIQRRYEKAIRSIKNRADDNPRMWQRQDQIQFVRSLETAAKAVAWQVQRDDVYKGNAAKTMLKKPDDVLAVQTGFKSEWESFTEQMMENFTRVEVEEIMASPEAEPSSSSSSTFRPPRAKARSLPTNRPAARGSVAQAKARPRSYDPIDLTGDDATPPWKRQR